MIQLTSRDEVLKVCPALGKYMYDWQQAEYEELQDSGSIEEQRAMLAEMDEIQAASYSNELHPELVYHLDAENIYEYIQKIGEAVFKLATECNWPQLCFLLLYKKPWLYQQNEYPPVKAELGFLKTLGMSADCADGIAASGVDIPRVLRSIFWLSRCNGALPYIHFSAPNSNVVMFICKNGYMHFYGYDETELEKIKTCCAEVGLKLFAGHQFDFLEGGAYIGRQMA